MSGRGLLVLLKRVAEEIRLWRRLALLLLEPAEKHVEQAFGGCFARRKKCARNENGGNGYPATPPALIRQLDTQHSPHPMPRILSRQ